MITIDPTCTSGTSLLGDGHTQPEDIALGETNDGLSVILGRSCRNERACIGVAHGHFTTKGRGDRCVMDQTAYTQVVGARDAELPLRGVPRRTSRRPLAPRPSGHVARASSTSCAATSPGC